MRFRLPRIARKHPIAFAVTLVFHIIILTLIFSYTVKNTWQTEKIRPKQKITSPVSKSDVLNRELVDQEKKRLLERREKRKQDILQLEKKRKTEESKTAQAKKKRETEESKTAQAKKKRETEESKTVQAKKKRETEESKTVQAKKKRETEESKTAQAKKKRETEESKTAQAKKKRETEESKTVQAKKKRETEESKTVQAKKKRETEESKTAQAKKKRETEELARVQAEKKRKQAEIEHKNIIAKNLALDKKIALATEEFKRSEIRRKLTRELTKEEIEENEQLRKEQLINITANYIAQIEAKTRSNWRRNANTKDGWSCSVYVRQTKEGKIKLVRVDSCNNPSKDFRRSVEGAVYKAEPLPKAPIEEVFDEEIQFNFIVR